MTRLWTDLDLPSDRLAVDERVVPPQSVNLVERSTNLWTNEAGFVSLCLTTAEQTTR